MGKIFGVIHGKVWLMGDMEKEPEQIAGKTINKKSKQVW